MKSIIAAAFGAVLAVTVLCSAAFAQELAVGGQAVGIQVSVDGVMVAGLSSVETPAGAVSPAEEAGIAEGDRIISVGGRKIETTADFVDAIAAAEGKSTEFALLRGDKELRALVTPVQSSEGQWAVGVWLRESISGIGTLTFYDPASGVYGALGHCISALEGGESIPVHEGSISRAEIVSVTPGSAGSPGALNGCVDTGAQLGSIEQNTEKGVFGHAFSALGGRVIETGEISTGRASILATVSGRETAEYSIEVNRVYNEPDGRHVLLTVTDDTLRGVTGGIVQGMSGSPIIQNGRLVGAVTHVFVSEPAKGYGISIQDMLTDAGLETEKAA